VADLNYINNNVSMQPAGADDWSPAVVNRPFTTGDYLWADTNSSAELHLNNAVLRIGPQTSLGFLNLDDHIAQFRFAQGELILHVRRLGEDESFEVDTPNAAITILREGEYRFQADPDAATTWVVVRHGQAELTGGGQAFTLQAGNSAQLSGTDQLAFNVQYAPPTDWFERWADDRQQNELSRRSARYLPPDVIGYEELDNYGTWRDTPGYGAVWYPTVNADWAPYRFGHWAWIEPWGWTWVDDAPWGFAPSHYGRWAYIGGGWGWLPGPAAIVAGGPPVMQAVWAPALVAFIGGGGWGASLSFGGPAVGWVPLGPGEVYAPAYQVSQNYFRSVNVNNTTVVNNVNITNVYNTVYVNKTVNVTVNQRYNNMAAPNAVTAMPQNAFASGRPVAQAGISVTRTQTAQLQPASMTVAPQVAPVRQALAPMAGNRTASQPPARAISMPVVAKATPPPPPVSFAAKQSVLQQNAGRPLNMQAVRQAAPARATTVAPVVRVAPPARQVTPQVNAVQPSIPVRQPMPPGAPNPPANRPPQAAPVTQPAPTNRPPQPANVPVQPTPTNRSPVAPPAQPAPTYHPPQATPPPAQPAPTYRPPQAPPPPAKSAEPPKEPSGANIKPTQKPKPAEKTEKPEKKEEKPKEN
jgi:hypothetical protein